MGNGAIELFASFAVLGELCVKDCLLARGDSLNAKLAKDRKARKENVWAESNTDAQAYFLVAIPDRLGHPGRAVPLSSHRA